MKSLPLLLSCASLCGRFLSAQPPISAQPPLKDQFTVCDVMENPASYANMPLVVRGEFRTSPHAVFLLAQSCRKPIISGRYIWPNAICLVNSQDSEAVPPVDFQSDWGSIVALAGLFKREFEHNPSITIDATIIGEIRASSNYASVSAQKGPPGGIGFCDKGAFPVMMIVRSVRNSSLRTR